MDGDRLAIHQGITLPSYVTRQLFLFLSSHYLLIIGAIISKVLLVLLATNVSVTPPGPFDLFTKKCSVKGL